MERSITILAQAIGHPVRRGPTGEDLVAQTCMDRHGMKRVERFDPNRDGVPPTAIHNCPLDEYDDFGRLEVFATNAFGNLVMQKEDWYAEVNWLVSITNGKYSRVSEGCFAQTDKQTDRRRQTETKRQTDRDR